MRRWWFVSIAGVLLAALLSLVPRGGRAGDEEKFCDGHRCPKPEKTLYVWAGDQARVAPDFLTVIDFDEDSDHYGKVIKTVPLPPPGNIGNEPHHCHLSADKNILGCGGLLSLLSGQPGIFFFDVSKPRSPKFLRATSAPQSSITDDFLPLRTGGFLVTQMGSASGGAPGRVAEFDYLQNLVHEWPDSPPLDGFNPHGIDARPELNLLVTSDFILPSSTLNIVPGNPVLRGSIRVWDLANRTILRTITIPGALGTMDVKLIPGDRRGRGYTAGMFNGLVYLIDPGKGTYKQAFDVGSDMVQILALPKSGDRLIAGLFQAGQVVMLDTTNRAKLTQVSLVELGTGAGPHVIHLTDDEKRLVVTDYFLNEDGFGKVHLEGDHKVHVIKVSHDAITLDSRFDLDFNTAFKTGPARPHGAAMK
ncbi:MAG: selenium-binding protein SBP56-related protein [Methylocella sp.]